MSKTRLKKATHQRSIKPRNIRVRSPAIQKIPPRPHHPILLPPPCDVPHMSFSRAPARRLEPTSTYNARSGSCTPSNRLRESRAHEAPRGAMLPLVSLLLMRRRTRASRYRRREHHSRMWRRGRSGIPAITIVRALLLSCAPPARTRVRTPDALRGQRHMVGG